MDIYIVEAQFQTYDSYYEQMVGVFDDLKLAEFHKEKWLNFFQTKREEIFGPFESNLARDDDGDWISDEVENAYYKRHNYQATYADEHEVRSMVLENKSSLDEMKDFLKNRNLNDQKSKEFAITPLSEQVADDFLKMGQLSKENEGTPFVLLACCPRFLVERVDVASADFRTWLNEKDKITLFGLDINFLNAKKEISSESIVSLLEGYPDKEGNRLLRGYVEIFRNGYVESATASELIWEAGRGENKSTYLQIAYFSVALWLYLKFIKELYTKIGYADEISIIISIPNIKGLSLHGFGRKNEKQIYINPYDLSYGGNKLTAKQKNFRYEKNVVVSEIGEEEIENIVKEVGLRLSNAFGETTLKCFDEDGVFDKQLLRSFRNIS